jgi:hypothetical protein
MLLRQGASFPYSSGTKYRKDRIYRATRTVAHIRYVSVIAAETIPEAFGPQSSGSLTTESANDYQSPARSPLPSELHPLSRTL